MATVQAEILAKPKVHKWTREEYYKLNDAGLFPDNQVELIEGRVIEMSPIYEPHASSVSMVDDALRESFGRGWAIRIQNPISIGGESDPQPDVVVVPGKNRDFKEKHPTTASLLVEVADSSLKYDQEYKGSLYARAGIADYWIVNLPKRQLEVYRRPIPDADAEFGFSYGDKFIFQEGESVSPLAKPDVVIEVMELLP